jgi:hypothetical protein
VLYYLLSSKYKRSSPADRDHKETVALLYICFVFQFLTSAISTGQEDRLMITALPLWIVAYLLVPQGVAQSQKAMDVSATP